MHRFDSFDVEVLWNTTFTCAEVVSGRANVLRALEATNVRGSLSNWLQISFCIGAKPHYLTRVGSVPSGESWQMDVSRTCLPCDIPVGRHTCYVRVKYRGMKKDDPRSEPIAMEIEVLPDDCVSVKMNKAELLAAHVMTSSPALSDFVNRSAGSVDGRDQSGSIRALYDAMRARGLKYQSVMPLLRMDCQQVRRPEDTLLYGGSCADLSLLFASLFHLKGLAPVLVMLEDHMMAGCWLGEYPGSEQVRYSAAELQRFVEDGRLMLLDCVTVCDGLSAPLEESAAQAAERIGRKGAAMVMVDVVAALRNGVGCVYTEARRSAGSAAPAEIYIEDEPDEEESPAAPRGLVCPTCGFRSFAAEMLREPSLNCPSCGVLVYVPEELRIAPAPAAVAVEEAPAEIIAEEPLMTDEEIFGKDMEFPAVEPSAPAPEKPAPEKPAPAPPRPLTISPETAVCVRQGSVAMVTGAPKNAEAVAVADVFQGLPVTKVRENAFKDCRMREASLAAGVRSLGDYAFKYCEKLEWIDLPDGLEVLGTGVFSDCVSLREARIPGTVKHIPSMCFNRCANLTDVLLGDGVEELDRSCFSGCTSLERIIIPASVRRIQANAFSGCTKLVEVQLLSDATFVDPHAFDGSGLVKK